MAGHLRFVEGWLLYLTASVSGAAGLKGGALAETMMRAALLTVALALFAPVSSSFNTAGRRERMHLTLKRDATKPAAANVLQQ